MAGCGCGGGAAYTALPDSEHHEGGWRGVRSMVADPYYMVDPAPVSQDPSQHFGVHAQSAAYELSDTDFHGGGWRGVRAMTADPYYMVDDPSLTHGALTPMPGLAWGVHAQSAAFAADATMPVATECPPGTHRYWSEQRHQWICYSPGWGETTQLAQIRHAAGFAAAASGVLTPAPPAEKGSLLGNPLVQGVLILGVVLAANSGLYGGERRRGGHVRHHRRRSR